MSHAIRNILIVLLSIGVLDATRRHMPANRVDVYWEYLSKTIDELSIQVHAELLLCINLNSTETSDKLNWLLQDAGTHLSKLIITEDSSATSYEINGKFKSRLLTIAFVTPSNILRVFQLVKRILWRLHFRDVFFIFLDTEATDDTGGMDLYHTLFSECWRNGFTQVLAVTEDRILYTYSPFPVLSLLRLPQLQAYSIKKHLQNFQGYTLRSPISNSSPRSYHYVDRNGSVATGGYFYQLVRTFIEHYNGTFEELSMPTYALNMTDMLKAFAARKIDIVANLLYMNSSYEHSFVLANFRVFIMAPYARPIPEYLYLIKPFTAELWLLLAATIVYLVPLIACINWRLRNVLDFSATFLTLLKTLLFLPNYQRRIRSYIQIFNFILLLLTGFLLTNFYLAKLSSLLATRVYGDQINTFDDIAKTQLLLPQTDVDLTYLQAISKIHPSVMDRIWVNTAETVHNLRRDLNTSFLHSGVEDKINFFLYQQKFLKVPYFRKIEQILYVLPVFIPMPHGSPFLLSLNKFLRRAFDTGIISKIIRDNEEDGILSGEIRFYHSESKEDCTLTFPHLMLAFLMLGIGLSIAAFVFILELIHARKLHPCRD